MKVACFSVAAMDFFPQQKKSFAGGNSLNQAIRFRQMGYQSTFVGALGTDDAGDQLSRLLQTESVDISCMYRLSGHTACNKIVNDDSGERFGIDGAWEGGVYEKFELGEADWEHINKFEVWSTHANSPSYLSALERVNSNRFVSVDFLHLKDYELLQKSLKVIDIAYFGGTEDMISDLATIAKNNSGIIVLTLGAKGSIAFEGDRSYTQEALGIEKIVDTTGCGDAFQAAFTANYFKTKDIRTSLLAGAELGKKAAMSFGGVPWE